jgi:lipopolysaccharide/colanic/teichoic acid biosynthesis glycosyltransferase
MSAGAKQRQYLGNAATKVRYAEALPWRIAEVKPISVPSWLRCIEIVISLGVLVVACPIMLFEALIIRLGTPGPALFFQTRLGANFKPFKFVKFRTFYHDARDRHPELYAYKYTDAELATYKIKGENDPRVTPQGRWLRRLSIDELPNFWNVFMGDMALVGPRPEIPELLPYYKGEMLEKFLVRQGITGLAQISGRGRLTFRETAKYDLEYARTRSHTLDLKILLTTARLILRDRGAF